MRKVTIAPTQTAAPTRRRAARPATRRKRAQERADDRAEPADAELPAGAVGSQRRRIDHRADDIDARLDAEHDSAGKEGGDQERGGRGQAGEADRRDDRDCNEEQKRDGQEAMPLQPPAQAQRADGAADLQRRARQRRTVGVAWAAVIKVGVQLMRKK